MRTILVVDDDDVIVQTLCMILNGKGYRAIGAGDSQQAEHQFDNNTVDLIIVDLGLPGMTGSELAKQFKETKPVLTIMFSGSAEMVGTPEAVDLLLPKPCPVPRLLAEIEGLFTVAAA